MGVDAAPEDDTVRELHRTYIGTDNRKLGFGARAITVRSENGPEQRSIDSEAGGRGFYFRNGETAESVVDGFTIISGSAGFGGGVCGHLSSRTLTHCVITGKTADCRVGGVCCYAGSAIFSREVAGDAFPGTQEASR